MRPERQFQEQGGAATMDPSPLRRWIISKVMTTQASEKRMLVKRKKEEQRRIRAGMAHVVDYFHQVDDGHSHLAAQVLDRFCERYDVEIRCHLVSTPTGLNVAEPELLLSLGLCDAKAIAAHYGLIFPDVNTLPSADNIKLAQTILAAQTPEMMQACINEVSSALWQDDKTRLKECASQFGAADPDKAEQAIKQGNARRAALKHYSSAMFYYAGEWYWGVDRLYHLEKRLQSLGTDQHPGNPLLLARPEIETGPNKDDASITLEIYVSLRSPYTAIVFDRALQLAKDTGVKCVVRPVLPMVMRGVPATKEKGLYILFDAAREARSAGVHYGKVHDPIGQPARHGYALYQWACGFNKGSELLSNFLRAAFAHGVNTNRDKGLQYVVEQTGLDWQQARRHLNDSGWQAELEDNRLTMYGSGLWGVPSFRLLNKQGEEVIALWGQDRLWLISKEIQRMLGAKSD